MAFYNSGLRAVLKRKNEHRHSLAALDTIVEESYPVGYETVNQEHKEKRPDLKGQFVYAALVDMVNKEGKREHYIATIKLDDSHADKKAQFKDIGVKKRSLYVGQAQNQNSANVNPPADRTLTIQQIIDFVKSDFKDSPLFTENMPPVNPENSSISPITEEEITDLQNNEDTASEIINNSVFSLVTDQKLIDKLDSEEEAGDYIALYRSVQIAPDGYIAFANGG